MTVLVAGSGPAGIFAALGALEAGAEVLLVDPGLRLEPEPERWKEQLGRRHWKEWTPQEWSMLQGHSKALSEKRLFGSDFATRRFGPDFIRLRGCTVIQSNALGGLSNLWGRGVEPPYRGECDHWPFHQDFVHSLQAVLSHIPLSAEPDNLAEVMPLHTGHYTPHRITGDSEALLERWNRHRAALNRKGVHFGKTRLALRQGSIQARGCQLCAMCFYGCPYGAMFDVAQLFPVLQAYERFSYRGGWKVRRFRAHDGGGVEVTVEDAGGGQEKMWAKKLIIAAGAVQTTTIAMRSLRCADAVLKSSDLIKIPFIRIFGHAYDDEAYHALSQLTLAVKRPNISRNAVLVHFFGKNPAIQAAVLSLFPERWRGVMGRLCAPVLRRVLIGMCFLHSEDSAAIRMRDDGETMTLSSKRSFHAFRIYLRLCVFFLMQVRKTGLLPIPGAGGVSLPGSSVHYGASMPIGGTGALSTDQEGRLNALPSVSIADAASLPDIPAGSYTLSIMANAYRIGRLAGDRACSNA